MYRKFLENKTVKVYNFNVDDFHTYFIGENSIWIHNASCVVHDNGEIEITDRDGYPEWAEIHKVN
ncbi:MAG: hypothetical protein GX905_02480 [Bacteroidales bacterium]|nr:hypothetical protein [Bacteroidales bacterium]